LATSFNYICFISSGDRICNPALPELPEKPYPFYHPDFYNSKSFVGPGIHKKQAWWKAWSASGGTIVGVTLFGVVGLYPNLLPSSMNLSYSLTIFNSASSPLTLKIMLGVALFFVPIVIIYQAWVYNFFKGKVKEKDLMYEEQY
jgi:cytochrome bd quinol oxidase subunit 2 apoprotein (EC 1.10.3.-)